jgi:hypothetical protein
MGTIKMIAVRSVCDGSWTKRAKADVTVSVRSFLIAPANSTLSVILIYTSIVLVLPAHDDVFCFFSHPPRCDGNSRMGRRGRDTKSAWDNGLEVITEHQPSGPANTARNSACGLVSTAVCQRQDRRATRPRSGMESGGRDGGGQVGAASARFAATARTAHFAICTSRFCDHSWLIVALRSDKEFIDSRSSASLSSQKTQTWLIRISRPFPMFTRNHRSCFWDRMVEINISSLSSRTRHKEQDVMIQVR